MKSSTTYENKSDPWAPAQPYIIKNLEQTNRVFDENQPFLDAFANESFRTYAQSAPGAKLGVLGAQDYTNNVLSGAYMGRQPGIDYYQSLMGAQNPYSSQYSNIAASGNPTQAGYQAVAGGNYLGWNPWIDQFNAASTSGQAVRNLQDTVDGKYLMGNPWLDANVNAAIGDATNSANAQFSAAGRYGSGAHSGVLASKAGGISAQMRGANYDAERNRQMEAMGMLAQRANQMDNQLMSGLQSGYQSERDRMMQGLAGLNQQDALRLQALQSGDESYQNMLKLGLTGAQSLDALYDNDLNRMQWAADQARALMSGSQGLLNQTAQLPWMGVEALTGNIRNATNGYGVQTGTQTTSGGLGNMLGGIAGGVLSGWASSGFK